LKEEEENWRKCRRWNNFSYLEEWKLREELNL